MNTHTTPVPNTLFDVFLKDLSLAELKVFLIIIRQTLGWINNRIRTERKEKDWISGSQLAHKTGCSKRAINLAIEALVCKRLIEVLSREGNILDSPDKRRGQPKLFYRLTTATYTHVNKEGSTSLNLCISPQTNANLAEDLRKKCTELTQKMRITK